MPFNAHEFPVSRRSGATEVDPGLRAHMLRIYNYMAAGLAISGIVAYAVSRSMPLLYAIFLTPFRWVVLCAPFLMVLAIGPVVSRFSTRVAAGVFIGYAALTGLWLSSIFLAFAQESVVSAFAGAMLMFLSMSIYGYTTKRDLTSVGAFLHMGVIGLMLAIVLNLFLQNGILQIMLSVVTVLLFTGLTAYDVQRARLIYTLAGSEGVERKMAILGALTLYLDVINIFLSLLSLTGQRR